MGHNKLWKILNKMEIPDHLTCLLRNLYAGQEATVRNGNETTDWFEVRKGVSHGYILSPCLFNLHKECSRQKSGWMNHKLKARLPEGISTTSDVKMISPLWQKAKRN